MKYIAIGDGNKRIACPRNYVADSHSTESVRVWPKGCAGVFVDISVFSIIPADQSDDEAGYWRAINMALARSVKPRVCGSTALFEAPAPAEEGRSIHVVEAARGNVYCVFKISQEPQFAGSPEFDAVRRDVLAMVESLEIRGAECVFITSLEEREKRHVAHVWETLMGGVAEFDQWARLREYVDEAYDKQDHALAKQCGTLLGEMLRRGNSSLKWCAIMDDHGFCRCLQVRDTGILTFVEDMILRRYMDGQRVNILTLASNAVTTIRRLQRRREFEF